MLTTASRHLRVAEPADIQDLLAPKSTAKPELGATKTKVIGATRINLGNALHCSSDWPAPTTIIVDGPYDGSGFPGDPGTHRELPAAYAAHIAAWTQHALPETTLWFWGTEVGWATVHSLLNQHGWDYRGLHIWDKGIGHIAGNVNSKTIRGSPIATEVCARYLRRVEFDGVDGDRLAMRQWLRAEWQRSGLPLNRTNEACGVKNAATRKYFTQDDVWYFPPAPMMELLANYALQHGKPTKRLLGFAPRQYGPNCFIVADATPISQR